MELCRPVDALFLRLLPVEDSAGFPTSTRPGFTHNPFLRRNAAGDGGARILDLEPSVGSRARPRLPGTRCAVIP
jgi:hypothetical protein